MIKILKLINLAFLITIAAIVNISCEKEDIFEKKGENNYSYNKSLDVWEQLKNENGNSYTYETTFGSWTGFGSTTKLEIKNGIVISRTNHRYQINNSNGEKDPIDSYSETLENLGSHDYGANPLTIDEVYKICAEKYLIVNKKKNIIYFETLENGLISLCGFLPKNCIDDCFTGISIESFNWTE
ncbi:hypothetical protein [Lutibacter citreus]|uniref:hypothetical protein n=1 Tax=Lutibacter citreus TaxID=2138210 RepID=UPI000DBE82B0|nr:hypothetical protein [Lutibacter citreus]